MPLIKPLLFLALALLGIAPPYNKSWSQPLKEVPRYKDEIAPALKKSWAQEEPSLEEQKNLNDSILKWKARFYNAKAQGSESQLAHAALQLSRLYVWSQQHDSFMHYLSVTIAVAEKQRNFDLMDSTFYLAGKAFYAKTSSEMKKKDSWIVIAIVFAAIAIISFIFYYIRSRQKIQVERQYVAVLKKEKEAQLLRAVMEGEEAERSRIARELHDGIAGILAAAQMHVSSLEGYPKVQDSANYKQALLLLDEAYTEIKKTAYNLLPEILFQNGLDEALLRFCNNLNKTNGISIQYNNIGCIPRLNKHKELTIYRVVQELVHNSIKHSKATDVIVQLTVNDGTLNICVEDNGIGFHKQGLSNKGIGLQNVRARVQSIGGRMELITQPNEGVSVYLEFDCDFRDEVTCVP